MIKMIIKMDDDKISKEGKYSIDQVYAAIDRIFTEKGMRKTAIDGGVEYSGHERPTDFAYFGRIMTGLKKQPWFMNNASTWLWCSNDDVDDPADFSEEDLLSHYGRKMVAKG